MRPLSVFAMLLTSAAPAATAPMAPAHAPTTAPAAAPADAVEQHHARLPGFAAELAQRPLGQPGADVSRDAAWIALIRSDPSGRQAARWTLADALLAAGRGAEAEAVLAVMRQDEPDLRFVAAWRRASGTAAALLDRADDGLAALGSPELARDPESCAWRMRLRARAGDYRAAIGEFRCAIPAIDRRGRAERAPFLLAIAHSAIASGTPTQAIALLATLPDRDAAANLLRGKWCRRRRRSASTTIWSSPSPPPH